MSPSKRSRKGPMDGCAALDASSNACNARAKEGAMWCPRHDEERIKLYINYKAHHASLDAFPNHTMCQDVASIVCCSSLDTVRGWHVACIKKYQLLTRCIGARAYFTERFFGNDMDFGHKTFWEHLVNQRDELENLMAEAEKRAYQLILVSQNALWVLEKQNDDTEGGDCSGCDDTPLHMPTPSKQSKHYTTQVSIEDPLDVAIREKCWQLWEKIKTRLARYCAPPSSKFYKQRLEVIRACVRRAIYTDPGLMLLSQNYKDVMSLLKDSQLDVSTVERLWSAIKGLSVHNVRAAVDDTLRPERTCDYVVVLGGRVYKEMNSMNWPLHAYGNLTAVHRCYSCLRQVCKSVDEVVALTRFAILTGGVIAQSRLKYDFGVEGMQILTLCGFIPNSIEILGPRSSVSKCNCAVQRNTCHWEETMTNFVLCAGLSLSDPKSQAFVNACFRHPDLMVMVRKGAGKRIIRSTKNIWATRTRHAHTRAGLQKVPWESAEQSVFQDSVLKESQPFISYTDRIQDCLQVAIVDGRADVLEGFVAKLVKVWMQVYGVKDEVKLLGEVIGPYLDSGEIEFRHSEGDDYHFMATNVETDVVKSYRRLWGSTPRQGELVDDDLPLKRVPQ